LEKEVELFVPAKVEIFELSAGASTDILYTYVATLQAAAIYPRILIFRFRQIVQANRYDAFVLDKIITRLAARNIRVLLSDVDPELERQMKKMGLMKKVHGEIAFRTIEEAVKRAEALLTENEESHSKR